MISPPEPLVQSQNILTEMFLMTPSTKLIKMFSSAEQHGYQSENRNIFKMSLATGQYINLCARTKVSDLGR